MGSTSTEPSAAGEQGQPGSTVTQVVEGPQTNAKCFLLLIVAEEMLRLIQQVPYAALVGLSHGPATSHTVYHSPLPGCIR
jgi:hypothetical protein